MQSWIAHLGCSATPLGEKQVNVTLVVFAIELCGLSSTAVFVVLVLCKLDSH